MTTINDMSLLLGSYAERVKSLDYLLKNSIPLKDLNIADFMEALEIFLSNFDCYEKIYFKEKFAIYVDNVRIAMKIKDATLAKRRVIKETEKLYLIMWRMVKTAWFPDIEIVDFHGLKKRRTALRKAKESKAVPKKLTKKKTPQEAVKTKIFTDDF